MSLLFLVPDSVPLLRFPFSEFSQSSPPSRGFFSFGIFRAALLFICQGARVFPGRNSITLPWTLSVVKTFFCVFLTFFRGSFSQVPLQNPGSRGLSAPRNATPPLGGFLV